VVKAARPFPVLRWIAALWMLVWLPSYVRVWGDRHLESKKLMSHRRFHETFWALQTLKLSTAITCA
jgi:hypothetical protein